MHPQARRRIACEFLRRIRLCGLWLYLLSSRLLLCFGFWWLSFLSNHSMNHNLHVTSFRCMYYFLASALASNVWMHTNASSGVLNTRLCRIKYLAVVFLSTPPSPLIGEIRWWFIRKKLLVLYCKALIFFLRYIFICFCISHYCTLISMYSNYLNLPIIQQLLFDKFFPFHDMHFQKIHY